MRLLQSLPGGELQLQDFDADDTPPYAILSHCWTGQEVTYQEMKHGTGTNKTGFAKLRFCCERAAADGLEYSWVDTCCIDKSDNVELSTAINSMFRWYQRASRCYVYLHDVCAPETDLDSSTVKEKWSDVFCRSRWFTRGWTLQELIAPATVDFFSKEQRHIGTKVSLEEEIHSVTKIPVEVLRGERPTATFSVEERMSWAAPRKTSVKEDKVYCLLGLFGVFLPLIYGEGVEYATARLKEEIQKRQQGTGHEQTQDLPVLSFLPLPRNENFVGRDNELLFLEKSLLSPKNHQRMAIHGLGGCGKSVLALEFAYRVMEKSPGHLVFWVSALSQERLELAYQEIAVRLRIPMEDNIDVKSLVCKTLSGSKIGHWLMVVDNADDSEVLLRNISTASASTRWADHLPHGDRGAVLFTSRSRKVAGDLSPGRTLELKDMGNADAEKLLAQHLTDKSALCDKPAIGTLFDLLTYLPLAIVQATAFINQNDASILDYTSSLQMAASNVESFSQHFEDPNNLGDLDKTVAGTWHTSFDLIRRQDPLAAEYLSMIACIDPSNIPQSLFAFKGSSVQQAKALGTLTGYAFLTERPLRIGTHGSNKVFNMHRLVHISTAFWLDSHGQLGMWADAVVARLELLVPHGGHERMDVWTPYLPHLLHVARLKGVVNDEVRASLLHRLGRCQASLGHYSAAIASNRRAISLREKVLGPDHADTLTSTLSLVSGLVNNGEYHEAEVVIKQLLAQYERISVSEQRSLSNTADSATVLEGQIQAEKGKEPDTQTSSPGDSLGTESGMLHVITNFAILQGKQGKWAEAEALHRQSLAQSEKLFGPEHPNTLVNMGSFAACLSQQGKPKEAEAIHRQVLEQQEIVLGPDHPDTLTSVGQLGMNLYLQRQFQEAESLLSRQLVRRERVLGFQHPETLLSRSMIATVCSAQGRFDEAEALGREILMESEKLLGPQHPDTAARGRSLGNTLYRQQRFAESIEVFRKAYAGHLAVYGVNHATSDACLAEYTNVIAADDQRRWAEKRAQENVVDSRSTSRESRLRRGLAKMGIGSSKSPTTK